MSAFQTTQEKSQLTNKEAAAYLGLSEATLNVWRCRRKGPAYRKVGRKIFYPLTALNSFLDDCLVRMLGQHI